MAYNRTKEIFEALEARDAVLLNEILENMNGGERASVLSPDRWVSRKRRHVSDTSLHFQIASLCW